MAVLMEQIMSHKAAQHSEVCNGGESERSLSYGGYSRWGLAYSSVFTLTAFVL